MAEVRAIDYTGSERLTMNMGPQHPSAHGVFRAILTLEGAKIVGVAAVIGHLPRCHEKLAETPPHLPYPSLPPKADHVAPPRAALYLFAKTPSWLPADSRESARSLLDGARIATVPGIVFGPEGERHLRFSFSVSDEMIAGGVQALAAFAAHTAATRR